MTATITDIKTRQPYSPDSNSAVTPSGAGQEVAAIPTSPPARLSNAEVSPFLGDGGRPTKQESCDAVGTSEADMPSSYPVKSQQPANIISSDLVEGPALTACVKPKTILWDEVMTDTAPSEVTPGQFEQPRDTSGRWQSKAQAAQQEALHNRMKDEIWVYDHPIAAKLRDAIRRLTVTVKSLPCL